MARPCKFCGVFMKDPEELESHEQLHRDIAFLNGNVQSGNDYQNDQGIETQIPEQESRNISAIPVTVYHCDTCDKTYKHKKTLMAHVRAAHQRQAKHSCSNCHRTFTYRTDVTRHEKTCTGETNHDCPKCSKRCASAYGLRRHLQWHEKAPKPRSSGSRKATAPPLARTASPVTEPLPSQLRCRRCTEVFDNRRDLYIHGMRTHYNQHGGALQPRPWAPNEETPWDGDDALRQVYETNSPLILEPHRQGPIRTTYNFPLTNNVNVDQLMDFADDIYRRQHRAFRLNLVFGVILQHRETGHYRYFVPYSNNGVFERPVYISRRGDLQRLRRQLQAKDILVELLRQRPDTKWIPVLVTNVHFLVTSTFYPLGQGQLPNYLMKKDSLYALVKNRNNGKPYEDNLCAFRCLALHRGHEIRCIEGPAKQLYQEWTNEPIEDFEGLSFEEFPEFENRFDVNLEVYNLTEDGFAWSVYKSRGQHETSMYVNLYENHLSYIRDFAVYAQKYQCSTCERHFKQAGDLHRHQKRCTNKTKFVYPGGFHRDRDNIFDQLDQYDIHVPDDQRMFPWYICYDFEALLQKVQDQPTDMLQWTHKHVPVSVSLCSNVEGYTDPVCLVDADQDQLVAHMVSRMNDIANRVYELAEEKWGWVLEAIDVKFGESEENGLNSEADVEDRSGDEVDDETLEDECGTKKPSHPLQNIYGRMEIYMRQVPVLGFNSAKYDLNLIKRSLAKHLNMHDEPGTFVVKKNNAYMCVATESLKFLDMSQFLAAGSSYAGFLQAYHVTEQKGFFPYEWFDDVSKLESTTLPLHEAFYSHLKGTNISEEEYTYCQRIWRDREMTSFRDFLVWYNNLDVGPFVVAVDKFQQFYFEKGVDVFKTAISVPGIARQLLFRTARKENANFALFDKQNEDLYKTIKHNIVGGPSIIFTRHHCAGQTRIRGQKTCGAILGFDANALYLQAIGKPMPVGPFVRRLADNDFRPELRDKYMSAYYWMEWLAHTHGIDIQHRLNTGREVTIGKYPVDGFATASIEGQKATVFQFHGCYWHGHLCDDTRGIRDEKWLTTRASKYQRTQETTAYLKREHDVVEMWECEFRQFCRQHPQIYDFIDEQPPENFCQTSFWQKHLVIPRHLDTSNKLFNIDLKVLNNFHRNLAPKNLAVRKYIGLKVKIPMGFLKSPWEKNFPMGIFVIPMGIFSHGEKKPMGKIKESKSWYFYRKLYCTCPGSLHINITLQIKNFIFPMGIFPHGIFSDRNPHGDFEKNKNLILLNFRS